MIQVKGLRKSYHQKQVIKDATITIHKGKITSFIGPNGAGKSTLLSMISRLMDADSGEVSIDAKNIQQYQSYELAKRVSILKQSNFMNVRLTVKELVSFGRFPYSKGRLTKEDEAFVDQAIAYMNLEELSDRYMDELSGGQRQRAFIAMVIAQDTDYILLDEPLNNLDMKHSVQIMKLLRKLVDELGKTVVVVLHDINFASIYSDEIVAMKDGEVVNFGSPESLIHTSVLKEIYDMEIPIQEFNNCRYCLYFK